jgi:hypothetical protein
MINDQDNDELFDAAPASLQSDLFPEQENNESDEDYSNRLKKWLEKQGRING